MRGRRESWLSCGGEPPKASRREDIQLKHSWMFSQPDLKTQQENSSLALLLDCFVILRHICKNMKRGDSKPQSYPAFLFVLHMY